VVHTVFIFIVFSVPGIPHYRVTDHLKMASDLVFPSRSNDNVYPGRMGCRIIAACRALAEATAGKEDI
jgi:hypothetical protein